MFYVKSSESRSIAERQALYPLLLDADWDSIGLSLRGFHDVTATRRAGGRFNIQHGSNWLARLMARMIRLPKAGLDVPSQVTIRCEPSADVPAGWVEVWERDFGGQKLSSLQWIDSDGGLVERFGRIELSMTIRAENGGLFFDAVRAGIALGRLRIAIPRWFAPRVEGRASCAPLPDDGFGLSVKLFHPIVGLVFAYEGRVAPMDVNP